MNLEFPRKVRRLISGASTGDLVAFVGLTLAGAVIDTFGVLAIPAFVVLVTKPQAVLHALETWGAGASLASVSPRALLLGASVLLGVFALFKAAFLTFVVYRQGQFVARQHAHLARRLTESYLFSPYTFHLHRNSAESLRNLTNDVVLVFQGVVSPAVTMMSEVLVVLLMAGILVVMEPLTTVLAFGLLGGSAFLYYHFIRTRLSAWGAAQQHFAGEVMKWLNQGLGAIKETKILGREHFFADRIDEQVQGYARAVRLNLTANQIPRYLIESVAIVGLALVLLVVLLMGRDPMAFLPLIALYAAAAFRLLPSLNRISLAATTIRYNGRSVESVHADLLLPRYEEGSGPVVAPTERADVLGFAAGPAAIAVCDVSYRYPRAAADSIADVTLNIPAGHWAGLIGASGAGKTTFVDLLLGLLAPTRGEIRVDGRDIRENLPAWQRRVGYVPQMVYLSDDTVRRNVAFALEDDEIDDQAVWHALDQMQLADFVRRQPGRLDAMVGERGSRLSGGQRQRIGVARALYHQPKVLVLDEATASLDPRTEAAVTSLIGRLRGERTLITIAHRLRTIRACDTLFMFHDGSLIASGDYDHLLEISSEFRSMEGVS
jgi:ATP-binding cassette subfamily C protein